MFRLAILLISLIWASLLLISWSGPNTVPEMVPTATASTAANF